MSTPCLIITLSVLTLTCHRNLLAGSLRPIQDFPCDSYAMDGDVIIAGVFPVHRYHNDNFCSENLREIGILHKVEAMAFAVQEINSRSDLLPNLTLGFTIFDDCSKDTTALIHAMRFISPESSCSANATTASGKPQPMDIVGVIGSESSKNTMQMADLFSIYRIPQISYISTSPLLSNKNTYEYFSRLVPPDTFQARAMLDIMLAFNWTYVTVLFAEGSYGREGQKAIRKRAEEVGICLAISISIKQSFNGSDYDNVIDRMIEFPRAKVVVIFTPLTEAKHILSAAKRKNCMGNYTWIGSDGWGRNIQDYNDLEDIAHGAITIRMHSQTIARFDDHFASLNPKTHRENPWFDQFWQNIFACNLASDSHCSDGNAFRNTSVYRPESSVSLVIDAVYAFAHSLHQLTLTECKNVSVTQIKRCFTGERVLRGLRSINFSGEVGYVFFDDAGDGVANYELMNLQKTPDGYKLVGIGLWDRHKHAIEYTSNTVEWNPDLLQPNQTVPISTCSDPCPYGYQQVLENVHCCWECERCRDNERTISENDLVKCRICPTTKLFTWPDDENRTRCVQVLPSYLTFQDGVGIGLATTITFLIILTIITAVVFLQKRDCHLIKASSRELMYIILIGVVISYVGAILFLATPFHSLCIIRYLAFHLSFTFGYTALVVKTNRIFRIFDSGQRSTIRPRYIETRYQVAFTIILICIQLSILSIAILVDQPFSRTSMPSLAEKYVELTCVFPKGVFLVPLVYNILLVVVCTFYGVKTRKLPNNYNESKFISFCVFTTIVLWMTFLPSFFLASKAFLRTLYPTLAMLVNGSVTIALLFFPKLYAVYYLPPDDMHLMTTTYPVNANQALSSGPGVDQTVFEIRRTSLRHTPSFSTKVAPAAQGHSFNGGIAQCHAPPCRPGRCLYRTGSWKAYSVGKVTESDTMVVVEPPSELPSITEDSIEKIQ